MSIQGFPATRHIATPSGGSVLYALSVTLGVEMQPVAVDSEGVSESLIQGCLWLTACPHEGTIEPHHVTQRPGFPRAHGGGDGT